LLNRRAVLMLEICFREVSDGDAAQRRLEYSVKVA
jgi:hypothetical protein